eukprot:jgi/Ulvmu1/9107/UM005_0202.1
MGLCASKPDEAVHHDRNWDERHASDAPGGAGALAAVPREEVDRRVEDGGGPAPPAAPDMSDRPEDIRYSILHTPPTDRRIEPYITSFADLVKRSPDKRRTLGSPNVITSLTAALQKGPIVVAKAAAHALKLLSFCHANHKNFNECSSCVPALIESLHHPEYRITVCCLSSLTNLAASPSLLRPFLADDRLLSCLERVLTQNIQDAEPQANAAQLLLNLCSLAAPRLPQLPLDDNCTVVSVATGAPTQTAALSRDLPGAHAAHLTMKSTRDSSTVGLSTNSPSLAFTPRASQHTAVSSVPDALHETAGTLTVDEWTYNADPVMPLPQPDVARLMRAGLHILDKAPAATLDPEARENCVEAVLCLLQNPETPDMPDAAAAAPFLKHGGLAIILREALRRDPLASTQVLVCAILLLFASSHADDLFAGKLVNAVGHMLSHKTKRGADERHLDLDVHEAALALVLRVAGLGYPHQQTALAHETVPYLAGCLGSTSVAIQLSACYVVEALQQNPHTRRALDKRDMATKLVELNQRQNALSTAPAVRCIGLLCELSRDNADAVVRANGLHTMLSTLEDDCPAQAQRHALVSISKVLRSAHRECLSPVLQSGRTITLAASVLYHTANSDVSNQDQWQAWCCRVLWDATEVDQACCAKVLSVLNKKSEVMGLIGVNLSTCTRREVLERLHTRMQECSQEFLTVVADLQQVEEAVAVGLVYGHHRLLSHRERLGPGRGAADQRAPRDGRQGRTAPHLRPPPLLASAAMRPAGLGGTTHSTTDMLQRTNVSMATALGSTCVHTLELTDSSAMGVSQMGLAGGTAAAAMPPHGDAQLRERHASPLQHMQTNAAAGHRGDAGGGMPAAEGRGESAAAGRRWKGQFRPDDEAVKCLPPGEGVAARGRGAGELNEGHDDSGGGLPQR